jgi:thiol-disulfide isomerase/thioredoxin
MKGIRILNSVKKWVVIYLTMAPLFAYSGKIHFHIPNNGIYFNIEKLSLFYPVNGHLTLHSYISLRGENTVFSIPDELCNKQLRVYYQTDEKGLDFFVNAKDSFTIKIMPFDTLSPRFEILGSYDNDYFTLFFSELHAFRSSFVEDIRFYNTLKKKKQKELTAKWKRSAASLSTLAQNYQGKHPVLKSILFFNCPKVTTDFDYWNSFWGWNLTLHFKNKLQTADTFLFHSFELPNQVIVLASQINDFHFTDPVEDPQPSIIDSIMFVFDKSPVFTAYAYAFLVRTYQSINVTSALDYLQVKYGPAEQCKDNPLESVSSFKQKVITGSVVPALPIPNYLDDLHANDTVVIVFWSSHCSYCADALPFLEHYAKDRKIKVLAISLDHDKKEWEAYTLQYPDWDHYCDFLSWKSPFVTSFEVEGTPSFFIISGKGLVLGRHNTWKQVRTQLK